MKTITLNDKQYKLAQTNEVEFARKFIDWAKPKLSDPLDFIKEHLKDIPDSCKAAIMSEYLSLKRQPLSFTHPDIEQLMRTVEGAEKLLCLMWQTHQPELTVDQVWELHNLATEKLGERYGA